ncbi:uroporphyrinogen decarboxylase [Caldanaerobius fijiensis DSM 17918]|uniref:Uroporphyrinogen decarboxylase n=1 Tax=Caldanaerobius fijiensis DSM 17918 TaxID=1121256 RepID=A0A1M4ZW54_9THEO|nr:uroporphyrinogen decarboxylase family protein [Caldanaerobius fijiensis]SHF22215.1 uroporphyrinogen decarboxylase [Caldanaerobius fijiensis DSM 17918]
MYKMTSHERFSRMFEHKEADRIPIIDDPWETTIERWHREGMPEGVSFVEFFDLDRVAHISVDNSPRYEAKIIEETDEYKIYTTSWGATLKSWKHITSTPEFLDFRIKDRISWKEAKERMVPSRDRIPWDYLQANYKKWREEGYWIQAGLWFGFDVTHSWTVGTERLLIALIEDPEWCIDMFNHFLDVNLALLDMVWDAGYHFDSVFWPDDMGYKNNQFFSVNTYRNLLKPIHKKAIDWAHSKGIKAHLHSCGDIRPFIPELIDIGLDALNPLEVKAGVDTIELKKKYGKDLVLHGGINAVLWNDREAIEAEIKEKVPVLKESGGYIFSSDHSVPDTVSLEDFRHIVELAKEMGKY